MPGHHRIAAVVLSVTVGIGALAFAPSLARADEECPLGSVAKAENGQMWCEPTVCEVDDQCPTGSLCRPVPLCVEVGALAPRPGVSDEAGQKLMVRQRCGADKTCPQRTTCSDMKRCITRSQADKAGLLAPAAASAGAATGTTGGQAGAASESPKRACGCHVPGSSGGALGGSAVAVLGLIASVVRRRRVGGTVRIPRS